MSKWGESGPLQIPPAPPPPAPLPPASPSVWHTGQGRRPHGPEQSLEASGWFALSPAGRRGTEKGGTPTENFILFKDLFI